MSSSGETSVLAASLAPRQTLRAWVSSVESYAPCEQRRCPTKLPQVLCLNANVRGENELNVWRGGRGKLSADAQRRQESSRSFQWLPHRIHCTVDVDNWTASVVEGHHGDADGDVDYELTAVVCHIGNSAMVEEEDGGSLSDSDDEPDEEDALLNAFGIGGGGARHVNLEEGHLVAHVRCPGPRDSESGVVSGGSLVRGSKGMSRAARQARMAAEAAAQSYARQQEAMDGSPGVWQADRNIDTPMLARRERERANVGGAGGGALPSELELLGISEDDQKEKMEEEEEDEEEEEQEEQEERAAEENVGGDGDVTMKVAW